jgi:hypothetical protein
MDYIACECWKKVKYMIEIMYNFILCDLFTQVDLYVLLNFIMILLGVTYFRDIPKTSTYTNVIKDGFKAFTVH